MVVPFAACRTEGRVAQNHQKGVVFVVDDDESVLRSLGRLIRSEGFDVRLFESAERFLEEVTATPSSCLVLDLTMPRLSGLHVQDELNKRGIRIPVIVLTARDDAATRQEAKRSGAKLFFQKPIDERTLIDAIDWAVHSDPDDGGV
jgi:FixJ family two-component response regulator